MPNRAGAGEHAAIRAALTGTRLFRSLSDAALDEAARAAHRVVLTANATLFAQGDAAGAFFVVLAGRLKVAQLTPGGQQVVIRYIGPGEMTGTVPLFTGTGYPASASAVVDSAVARWDRDAAHRLAERHPALLSNALAIVGTRLQELQARYRELATQHVEQRVAHAVLRLLAEAGCSVTAGSQVAFPVSRQDIAEMTGTTLHRVSRILSAWEHAGVLETGRLRLAVRRPDALRRAAGNETDEGKHASCRPATCRACRRSRLPAGEAARCPGT